MDKALETGELFDMEGWKHIAPAATEGTLHLIGLLSDGGVHSRYDQLKLLFDGVSHCHPTCANLVLPILKGSCPDHFRVVEGAGQQCYMQRSS